MVPSLGVEVPVSPAVNTEGGLVDVLDVDRHGDRVGVGPVGDLDHDGAGVGVVVAGAAACRPRS